MVNISDVVRAIRLSSKKHKRVLSEAFEGNDDDES